jgi:DNA polymerase III subunit delta
MIFFLYGPDTFRSRQKLKEIKAKFIREIDKSALNIETLDGEKLNVPDLEKALFTPAFLAKKRLVIVENLLSKNKGKIIQNEVLEILEKNDLADVILVFWESGLDDSKAKKSKAKKPGKRSLGLFTYLAKEELAQKFGLLDEYGTHQWAAGEFKKRGGKIQPQALKLLTDLVGNDLWQLSGEIDKLLAFTRGGEITAAHVGQLVKIKLDEDTFKLTDALAQKNKKVALKLISDQLKNGVTAVELLTLIIWQFKNLLIVKSFMAENGAGYPPTRLTYQLGLHPFVVKKAMAMARNYQLDNLKNIYRHLLGIDYKIKTSQINAEVLFDLLVVKN